jgi:hypothetical protein
VRRPAAYALALLALAGCAATEPGAMVLNSLRPARAVVTAAGPSVTVVPPAGYCLTRDAASTTAEGIFLLAGDCADRTAEDGPSGILTAAISFAPLFVPGQEKRAELDRLEEFLSSPRGLALVGRGGDVTKLRIMETYREGEALILFVEDAGDQVLPVTAPRFWRAFLEVNGRMVSLSAARFRDGAGDDRDMLPVLRRFMDGLRAANPAPGPSA